MGDSPWGLAGVSMDLVNVSQVAYDRFVLELPPADATWRPLADTDVLAETASWLWAFGPAPIIAVVGYDGALPDWLLDSWSGRRVAHGPHGAASGVAITMRDVAELERLLSRGAPHDRTVLLWPRTSEAKTMEALAAGGEAWLASVDAYAEIERNGEVFQVHQSQPA